MSDRSSCTFKFLACDEPLIVKACPEILEEFEQADENDGVRSLLFSDENGGGSDKANELVKAGLTFLNMYNGCSGAYPPGIEGAFFGDHFDCVVDDNENFMVQMDYYQNRPSQISVNYAQAGIAIKKKIDKYFEGDLEGIEPDVAKAILLSKSRLSVEFERRDPADH
jgi:hypothetical protein